MTAEAEIAGTGSRGSWTAVLQRLRGHAVRRLGWGVADQAVSSVTNFAVNIIIAHDLGAVQYGAFSLAYVTYTFVLNASRGLSTDPLLVRFSGTHLPRWRRAVTNCTGTATVVGLFSGACVIAAAVVLGGTAGMAFLALGLTLPGLMLQDSWRYSFFALGRGSQAFLNDAVWGVTLLIALEMLRITGYKDVFWFVLAWGATAGIGAALGPLQAKVVPRLSGVEPWLAKQRDLGIRYLAEGASSTAAQQLRTYGIGVILGLAAVGYVQAASTLMGPVTVLFLGMSLVAIPEGARILERSPRRLPLFCMLVSGGLTAAAVAWGVILLVAVPRGLGAWLLGPIWRPTYPLLLPVIVSTAGICVAIGAGAGLHALGAARRSLRTTVFLAPVYVVCGLIGALEGGAVGTMRGNAISAWLGALVFWWQLSAAMRESGKMPSGHWLWSGRRKPKGATR
jgi:O-antigen/teichoic acid export membrane protein